jgi:ankyrin repeat protein
MVASQNGHTEALALLLANGANVNAAMQVLQNLFTISYEFLFKYISKLNRFSRILFFRN